MIVTELVLRNDTQIGYYKTGDGVIDYTRVMIKTDEESVLLEVKEEGKNPKGLPIGAIEIVVRNATA